jgi:asparagine synthase (glutamine-hydrolysing)
MTALAGYWSFGNETGAAKCCARMLDGQQAYAPEAPVSRAEGPIAMGRRLFSTLPEDEYDLGPVESGGRILIADVRLDNRDELAASLGLARGEASTLSDSALLMSALDHWDVDGLGRLVGDFAFALWDGARSRLLLARDFLGHRPLHYHRGAGFFAFASMPKGLHALPDVEIRPNMRAAADFLALLPESGSDSFFEGIEKVQSGHFLVVTPDSVSAHRYWDPPRRTVRLAGPGDYAEALREQLDTAVAAQLRGANGQVAAHLSGGLDSGAVAATAARLLASSGGRVTASTSVPRPGFESSLRNSFADEGPFAAAVAAMHPNIDHVRIAASGRSPIAALDDYFRLYERPFLNLANGVWLDAILADVRDRGLRILLTGAMGNMSFSYDGMQLLPNLLARGRLARLARESRLLRRGGTRIGTIAAQALGPFLPRPLWNAIGRIRGKAAGASEYSMIAPVAGQEAERRAAARGIDLSYRPQSDPFEARMTLLKRVDFGNYNKGMLAGWGIDVRDPTSDRRLVEFCLSVPPEQFLAGGQSRALARNALSDRMPQMVLAERRKGYQAADWHEGLCAARGALRAEVERQAATPESAELLDTERMLRMVDDWPEGGWDEDQVMRRYRLALLRGVSIGHFLRSAAAGGE